MVSVKSLTPVFVLLGRAVAQSSQVNLTSTNCVDVSGFESCQKDATAKDAACLAQARKDASELEVEACACASYIDNINCAASHCWNRVNECEYQEYVVAYLVNCPIAKTPLPYFPAPDNAPDACSCNVGKVYLAINGSVEQGGKCSSGATGGDAFGNVQKIQGCECCEISGALSSIYGICPDTDPKLIGLSSVSKLESALDTPFDTCASYLSESNCVSSLGFSKDAIQTYYRPDNLPKSGTATLSNKAGTVTAPASGSVFTYTNAADGKAYTVSAAGASKGSGPGSDSASGSSATATSTHKSGGGRVVSSGGFAVAMLILGALY